MCARARPSAWCARANTHCEARTRLAVAAHARVCLRRPQPRYLRVGPPLRQVSPRARLCGKSPHGPAFAASLRTGPPLLQVATISGTLTRGLGPQTLGSVPFSGGPPWGYWDGADKESFQGPPNLPKISSAHLPKGKPSRGPWALHRPPPIVNFQPVTARASAVLGTGPLRSLGHSRPDKAAARQPSAACTSSVRGLARARENEIPRQGLAR